ncbi:hypothetical protein [Variovorax sp. OV084]|jgi:hypothetical protein|uniref:hypothetical protein n=1 Tax=Variovorax sp. OV084 TaxID=1882777 RepID=UPI0008CF4C06|nr:hypothetical protein [Variovorax sp. OV084]SET84591.1 hypothetical protein SAMN05443580_107205 [Variovorax sp. OV084]
MNQFELFFPRVAATALPIALSQQAPPPSLPQEDREEPFQFEDVEVEARVTYAVRLADYPHPAADAVKVAEQRFRREIDRQLGADVVEALRAFQNASESSESDLSKAEIAMAKRWAKAYDAARTAGFRDLGDTDEAFFDVRSI